jgi:hypothetical protein
MEIKFKKVHTTKDLVISAIVLAAGIGLYFLKPVLGVFIVVLGVLMLLLYKDGFKREGEEILLQKKAFEYLRLLDAGASDAQLAEIADFVSKCLCIDAKGKNVDAAYLREKLNRPMRVCGVVKNVGEPGGGPFLTYNQDGTVSLQILESSQIDTNNEEYMKMFTQGTHFNPVDLVCAVKNYKGEPFNLPDFVDKTTGFISSKSKAGKELKALELPGLWNGAMSNWSTVFVEVPLGTFNPVKTVNDLLRDQHQ